MWVILMIKNGRKELLIPIKIKVDSNFFLFMNNMKTDEMDYEMANDLCNKLWNEYGDGQIDLSETHYAFTLKEWDGKDKSNMGKIVKMFEELFNTLVFIDLERETVNLEGAVED